ncbi:MAG: T9SS type A sorting domain-containing protein [Cytophagales bacterium]
MANLVIYNFYSQKNFSEVFSNLQDVDYQLFNFQGQLLQKGEILAENRQTLDTDFLPKGIYFIDLKGENGARKVEKLVKM